MAVHKVPFLPLTRTVEVDDAKYPLADHGRPGSLLDIALAHHIHLQNNRGGSGDWPTCALAGTEGGGNPPARGGARGRGEPLADGAGRGGSPRYGGGPHPALAARVPGGGAGRRG